MLGIVMNVPGLEFEYGIVYILGFMFDYMLGIVMNILSVSRGADSVMNGAGEATLLHERLGSYHQRVRVWSISIKRESKKSIPARIPRKIGAFNEK